MQRDIMGQSPEIQRLLETILPDEATPSERTDFARGLALLADLVDGVDAGTSPEAEGEHR